MKASIQHKLFENKDIIFKRYNETKSCRIVAEELGVGMVTIWTFLKKYSNLCHRRKLTEKQERELSEDYSFGISMEKVGKKYGISYTVARDYLIRTKTKFKKRKDYRKHIFNQRFFNGELTEAVLWFLGWVYSDGNVSKTKKRVSVTVHKRDREVLEKLQNLINGKELIVNANNRNVSILYMFSEDMAEDLIRLGCIPAKSLIIEYPTFLQNPEQHWAFLRGIFEGDGHISLKHKGRGASCEISSGSLEFLKSIQTILKKELNLDTKIYERPNSNSKRIVIMGGIHEIKRFMDAIYMNSSSQLRMDRKYNLYIQLNEACKNLIKC